MQIRIFPTLLHVLKYFHAILLLHCSGQVKHTLLVLLLPYVFLSACIFGTMHQEFWLRFQPLPWKSYYRCLIFLSSSILLSATLMLSAIVPFPRSFSNILSLISLFCPSTLKNVLLACLYFGCIPQVCPFWWLLGVNLRVWPQAQTGMHRALKFHFGVSLQTAYRAFKRARCSSFPHLK